MRDQCNELKIVAALGPQTVTGAGDVTGPTIDRTGYDSVTFVIALGAEGDTYSGALFTSIEMEHSDDGSAWSDVAPTDVIVPKDQTTVLAAPANGEVFRADAPAEAPATVKVGYNGDKQFVRLIDNITGTHTNGTPVAAFAILGNPAKKPVTA